MQTNVGRFMRKTDQQHGNKRNSGSSGFLSYYQNLKMKIMEWFEVAGGLFFIVMLAKFGNNGRGLMER
ncbi:hypothetical protein J2X31_003322 [Flavobacterium arsenatis]|uniref:Uncharacterized protein n=1 Tax=Flavobacterium arsenatis TaxID=1484332 RepID=A0ABU1TTT7_9FLAO|nr:hypothetical protein [Flavobacterium arsenatis]MDR6969292.1 hypothetical protein [Flavobacterium arsenatis]